MNVVRGLFANYEDAETRAAMIDFVARTRSMDAQRAERELMTLNHVGLAYLRRDMLEAERRAAQALADYDPLAF